MTTFESMPKFFALIENMIVLTEPNGTVKSADKTTRTVDLKARNRTDAWTEIGWPKDARSVSVFEYEYYTPPEQIGLL